MTHKIDVCRFLTRCSIILGYGKDWLAHCQDNETEWEVTMSVQCPKSGPKRLTNYSQRQRVGEMEEDTKSQDVSDKALLISILS